MKAVLVLNDLRIGGTERQALLLARALSRRGWDVSILGLSGPGDLVGECEEAGIRCEVCHCPYPWSIYYAPSYLLKALFALRRLGPDVILAYTSIPNAYCGLIWKMTGAKACLWNQRDAGLARPIRWMERMASRNVTAFMANSCSGASFLMDELGIVQGRIEMVRNAVALPEKAGDCGGRPSQGGGAAFEACMVGNLRGPKDHVTLVRAWKQVVRELSRVGRSARLRLVGRLDEETEQVRRCVREAGLEDSVDIMGFVKDVHSVLCGCDIGVFSSGSEGQPNGVLECMAAGLAVVSTDLPGVRECVPEEQMPYLVPPADSETMAEKILLLAGNGPECRRLGKVNRRHIEEVFSPDVVSGRTCGFIESVSG